ncbi:hypothetical protein [Sphingomonas nostoxanthinifaciens]|uniref:hypothetical protein n=1 Tax=Sphingomonas nostoxanthinifaciens TaxID=2872652 RepID=UPI001CC1D324|nr:hypothetical protein [Sphingomonas nostoxanthinifaciens]UAK23654.1 hypothetical protein K8P63_14865 [Sphingomonas nostoxanthinifaciens]
MANDLTTAAGRAVATPEGALALRRISSSVAWTEDDAVECSRWLNPALAGMLPTAIGEARAQLAPALVGDFRRLVSPTLTLVAPAGMSQDDATAWLATAAETLRGIPADLLERGCMAARRKVDHPSKIIAAIFAEIGGAWERRKADLGRLATLERIAADRPEPPAGDPFIRPEEATAIIDEFNLRADRAEPRAPRGPARMPTVADYMEIGLSRDAAARAVANAEAAEETKDIPQEVMASVAPKHSLRDQGHLIIAKAIANRFRARRDVGVRADDYTALARRMIDKHGQPPLAWLIGATRQQILLERLDAKAA